MRAVDAVLVVVEADLGQPQLAGILEPAEVARLGDAELVIFVQGQDGAGAVGDGDDRAALVLVGEAAGSGARALVPGDQLVGPVAAPSNILDKPPAYL